MRKWLSKEFRFLHKQIVLKSKFHRKPNGIIIANELSVKDFLYNFNILHYQ